MRRKDREIRIRRAYQNNEKLVDKIARLQADIKKLHPKACKGDVDAMRLISVKLQKIEVTQNRLAGDFGRYSPLSGMLPVEAPKALRFNY